MWLVSEERNVFDVQLDLFGDDINYVLLIVRISGCCFLYRIYTWEVGNFSVASCYVLKSNSKTRRTI